MTDMSSGLTRKEATEELTREGVIGDAAASSPIESLAMSSDGRRVALTSSRTTFVLPTFSFIGSRRQLPGVRELYVLDLVDRTIERAAHSADGGEINGPVSNGLTLSSDGGRIAFTSSATNLFIGDFNQRADAFALTRQPDPEPEEPLPPPAEPPADDSGDDDTPRRPRLRVQATSTTSGVVRLVVTTPRAGVLAAVARARLGQARRRRTVATKSRRVGQAGRVTLLLRLRKRYRDDLRRAGRVRARVALTLQSGASPALKRSVGVVFGANPPRGRKKR